MWKDNTIQQVIIIKKSNLLLQLQMHFQLSRQLVVSLTVTLQTSVQKQDIHSAIANRLRVSDSG